MYYLFATLIIILPLLCERLFLFFWIEFPLSNLWYEALKSNFLTLITPVALIHFLLSKYTLNISKKLLVTLYLLAISILISSFLSPDLNSAFIWNLTKWHTFFFIISLIVIFIISQTLDKDKIKKVIIYSSIPVCLIAIKEIILPSFDYSSFWLRALWSLWHHNYLAWFLLIVIPLTLEKIQKARYKAIFILLNITLLLTQSLIWIWVACSFYLYLLYTKTRYKLLSISIFIALGLGFMTFIALHFNKAMSLISRFYIWKDSFIVWLSNLKSFLFWIWPENFYNLHIFYKSPELLVYENLWFIADRSHNFIVEWLLSFGIIWSFIIVYLFKESLKKIDIYSKYWIVLSSMFLLFNFASWALLLIFILLFSFKTEGSKINKLYLAPLLILSVIWSYVSLLNITWESLKLESKNNLTVNNIDSKLCLRLWEDHTPELYFICWEKMEKGWLIKEALAFYEKWINNLPILKDYSEKIKYEAEKRLYSEKYWLPEIHKKIEELR